MQSVISRTIKFALGRRVRSVDLFKKTVAGKFGVEIGGPSDLFGADGMLPIYEVVGTLNNVTFSVSTVWAKDSGSSLICDGTDLSCIPDAKYDFVLSCHNLEHIANPIKALREWRRVTKKGGALILVLPDHRYTFDHSRPLTSVEHLVSDFENGTDESDLTHLPEILELHDLARDPAAGTKEAFRERSLRNFENRCLHHHVFNLQNSVEMLKKAGYSVELAQTVKPIHIVLLAR